MTGRSREIDQFVKARWRAIGLSPNDLAEVLTTVAERPAKAGHDKSSVGGGRLMHVATALGLASGCDSAGTYGSDSPDTIPAEALLELRLLRLFRDLHDPDTRRMLVQLVEQIVKRQGAPRNAD